MNVATWPRVSLAADPGERMRISGVGSALPAHRYPQAAITAALKRLWRGQLDNPELLDRLHARARVDHRHFALPIEAYEGLSSWGVMNAAWIEAAEELGARALERALIKAGVRRDELQALFVVSISGIASPSLDARLINRLGLRPDIKRTPIFGVGCVGGALGLSRAADHTLAYPDQHAAVLSVELCSLTFQRGDLSAANLVSTGLFGDGAVAAIVSGAASAPHGVPAGPRGPAVLDSRSVFYPDTQDIMGWDISERGFQIVLSPALPELIRRNLAGDVAAFLAGHDLARADIGNWVIHTGGPKVLEAIQEALQLEDADLDPSWDSLRRVGNLSSASVLLVLEDIVANRRPPPGTLGVLVAMGPGFCAELILLRW
jgi:alkylresorcinol/alkylpyrone synthase